MPDEVAQQRPLELTIQAGAGGGAFVELPGGVVERLGGGGRIPVIATFEDFEYRGSVVRMGGKQVIGVLKSIREAAGKEIGDRVRVTVKLDTGDRHAELPTELAEALALDADAARVFESLSYSHQREHARYVSEAKRPETRLRRAARTVEALRA